MYFLTYDNENNHDGFGSQIQRIISLYLLTTFFKLNYFHSNIIINRNVGFKSLKDITNEIYLEKFNNLFVELKNNSNIEFKTEIRILSFDIDKINSIITNPIDYNVLIKICNCHDYIDNNPTILEKYSPPSLNWVDNKLNNKHLNIACHIRRGDVSLTENVERYVNIDMYINIINNLTIILSEYSFEYNIYCDSITSDEMSKLILNCSTSKITFHITDEITTFIGFVNSDILIAGYSSFSYAASFLRQKGIILYIPIRHAYSEKHVKLEHENSIFLNKEKIYQQLKIAKIFKPDLFLSCGENCLCAFILKYLNLRDNSYLFDWASCEVFKILPDILSNTLEHHIENNIINNNNFENLTLYNFGEGERQKIIYVHHPDKDYQERVSRRFFDAINSSKKIVFVYTYGKNNLFISDEEFDNLISIIVYKYPNLEFRLLILKYIGEGCEINLVRETSFIKKYEYKSTSLPPWHSHEIYKCEMFKDLFNTLQFDINSSY